MITNDSLDGVCAHCVEGVGEDTHHTNNNNDPINIPVRLRSINKDKARI